MAQSPSHVRKFRSFIQEYQMKWDERLIPRKHGGDSWSFSARPEASESKGTVFFLHGFGNDSLFPQSQIFAGLLKDHWSIVSYDLDGHGRQSSTELIINRCADSLVDCLNNFEHMPRPWHVVGYSFGACHIAKAAHQGFLKPFDFTTSILIAMPIIIDLGIRELMIEIAGLVKPAIWAHRKFYGALGPIPAFGKFRRQDFPVRWAQNQNFGGDSFVEQFQVWDMTEFAKHLDLPTLIICGSEDGVAKPRHMQNFIRQLPTGEIKVINKETHLSILFNEQLTKEILRWIA
jgi:pimeloyl-ACP methyl ester carboxylesterase